MKNPSPETIIRACMSATPGDHPDFLRIQARLSDPKPIVPCGDLLHVEGERRRFPVNDPRYVFPK